MPFPTTVMCGLAVLLLAPTAAFAQQSGHAPETTLAAQAQAPAPNVPAGVQQAETSVEDAVERFRIGVEGGVGLDPELIIFGAHAAFGPIFKRGVEFRPGFEFGLGEITTMFGVNLDVIYTLPGSVGATRWAPYVGAGPNFALSHRSVDTTNEPEADEDSRFDFSDTDFKGGVNFLAGVRSSSGVFFELKATAYGVSTLRLLAGFSF